MRFLSTNFVVVSLCTGIFVVLFARTSETDRLVLNRFQSDERLRSNRNAIATSFSSRASMVDKDYADLPPKRFLYGDMKVQRRLIDVQKLFVGKHGSVDFNTVQEAVDFVMDDNTERIIIHIEEGTYKEKVHVPTNKPYITFEGAGMHRSIISWDDNAAKSSSVLGTATVVVDADFFIGHNISFKNTAGIGAQAIALRVSGDAAAFYGCGMYGYQDTLNDDQGRHLFRNCYIEGAVDFIFGNGRSLYERCTIKSIASELGFMTAQSRGRREEVTGFGFVNCNIGGTGILVLGRAWRRYACVVIASSHMDDIIDTARWDAWGNEDAHETIYFGEHDNSGPGANINGDVPLLRRLSSDDAAKFTRIKWIDGSDWLHE